MMKLKNNKKSGFTLIELLVVISIVSLLSSTTLTKLEVSKQKTRDSARVQNTQNLQIALESYYNDNGFYPITFSGPSSGTGYATQPGGKRAQCVSNPNDYIPNLVPNYMTKLPSDPNLNCNGVSHSWVYASNGVDYKLITHNEQGAKNTLANTFADPAWDGGQNPCILDGNNYYHYGIWTAGAACWSL